MKITCFCLDLKGENKVQVFVIWRAGLPPVRSKLPGWSILILSSPTRPQEMTATSVQMSFYLDDPTESPPRNVDMSLIRFSRWKNAARNAEVKDMVLILATEFSKGKFAVCVIDSVKKDQDKKVRKVVVKYKVRAKKHMKHYKYTEKKVRGLALLVTAQERLETETVDMDLKRFDTEDQTCQESWNEIGRRNRSWGWDWRRKWRKGWNWRSRRNWRDKWFRSWGIRGNKERSKEREKKTFTLNYGKEEI